jgi:2-polyprenyl-3-methyl-5-hydroxy-6-metoxy-1,4-benzoquinol methylase
MGHSDPENKQWAIRRIAELQPKTILDVGAGAGTYCTLIKQYIDPHINITGIEAWEPNIQKYRLLEKYNRIILKDVREHKEFNYDLVIFGDVLEHMTKEESINLWNNCISQCKCAMISIPIIHYPQEEIEGNPYEVHVKDDWTPIEVLESFKGIYECRFFKSTGTFFAEELKQ